MNYRPALQEETEEIFNLVQETIKTIYPKYYPAEVVEFFCNHHSLAAITEDIKQESVSVLTIEDKIVGTGSYVENHITRVYVAPTQQGNGYGTFIMETIEREIVKKHDKAYLDASLPAAGLYEKLGYHTVKHEKHLVENDVVLVYEVMEKIL